MNELEQDKRYVFGDMIIVATTDFDFNPILKISTDARNVVVIILSVSYGDSIGNDHYFTEPKGIMFFWDENWDNATIISGRYHKATVNELIEHFKIKEE